MQADHLKQLNNFSPGPVQKINIDWGRDQLFIKRLDLIQSWASGNKYYKLKHHLADCVKNDVKCIVSKGGMFSNHLHALATACAEFGIDCVCLIRSYGDDASNPSLQFLHEKNCKLIFLDPAVYKQYDEQSSAKDFPGSLFIPEGGADEYGIRGAQEIMMECLEEKPDYVIVAGGTMSTALGMLSSAPEGVKVIAVPAWKGCTEEYIDRLKRSRQISSTSDKEPRQISSTSDPNRRQISSISDMEVWADYHFGGFGKYNQELADFMYGFTESTGIPLDPVYTGKLMFAIKNKMESGFIKPGEKVLVLHTGGLQGIAGYVYRDADVWGKYGRCLEY